MSDVEKYGVFALVFVLGVLGLILFYEPAEEEHPGGLRQAVIIRSASDVPLTAGVPAGGGRGDGKNRERQRSLTDSLLDTFRGSDASEAAQLAGQGSTGPEQRAAHYRVRSPADGVGAFDFTEPPLRYPGDRTSLGSRAKNADGSAVHVVAKGETLMHISKIYYGTTTRWKEILRLNPKLDPVKMRPGDEVFVAAASPAAVRDQGTKPGSTPGTKPGAPNARKTASGTGSKTKVSASSYTVKQGDTLGQIAQKLLGSARLVDDLYAANRGVLDSPDDLKIGMVLSVPVAGR